MRNIAVVGGSGFIGQHLVSELLSKGYNVCIIDQNKPSIAAPFIQCNVLNADALEKALKNVDAVFDLASLVGVDNCLSNDNAVREVTLQGTHNILHACKINSIKCLFFSSSSEVYGDGNGTPFAENAEKNPKSTYAKTKLAAEQLLEAAATSSLVVRVVRYFNAYGPGQRSDFVMKRFLKLALREQPITIYGDGNQVRCFMYIQDAIQGSIAAMEYEGPNFEVFNIGNASLPIKIRDLALLIKHMTNSSSPIRFVALDSSETRPSNVENFQRIPDTTKAMELLHFKAEISLEDGLRMFLMADETLPSYPIGSLREVSVPDCSLIETD